jgi:acetyl-CoA carboxylase biotin carboxylase subunit
MIEESVAAVESLKRAEMGRIACEGVAASGYQNVGTVEFLVSRTTSSTSANEPGCRSGTPVTELVTGIDLVKLRDRAGRGDPLPFAQQDVVSAATPQCRVTAEDPTRGFAPDAGHIHTAHLPGQAVGARRYARSPATTPPYYDSLLAKIITWGRNRNEAIARMGRAIDETEIQGVKPNLDYLALVLSDARFLAGDVDVEFVERQLSELETAQALEAAR